VDQREADPVEHVAEDSQGPADGIDGLDELPHARHALLDRDEHDGAII
jgi:hypothetical protein